MKEKTWQDVFKAKWDALFDALTDEQKRTVLASPSGAEAAKLAVSAGKATDGFFGGSATSAAKSKAAKANLKKANTAKNKSNPPTPGK